MKAQQAVIVTDEHGNYLRGLAITGRGFFKRRYEAYFVPDYTVLRKDALIYIKYALKGKKALKIEHERIDDSNGNISEANNES